MRKIAVAVLPCLLLFVTDSYAREDASFNDLKIMFTGNTVEGKLFERDVKYKMYLHPSGTFIRLDSNGLSEKGEWHINKQNELCLSLSSQRCYKVSQRGKSEYGLHERSGELALTIDNVILGNPDKLKP